MPADATRSVADYAQLATDYDRRTRLINAMRLRAVAALALAPGDVVLDAGCGTGFSFAPILEAIGARGRLLAFDHSPELLAVARARVAQHGWRNVTLREGPAETVRFDASADALLFSYVHDVLQSEAALDNALSQAKAGARVAACGSVLWPWWGAPVNAWLRARHRGYITNMENLGRPWAKLAARLAGVRVEVPWPPGWRYLATGRVPA
ncbi:MAG: class I SAM-dependent methyltransferase [Betaproteobacteria bacterium]|nr:class I SAM-dependent methyltransferase [Betaproteobacteria bacterium]MDH5221614.1 class I SAM-dependent methyltransferase [Betaproteobacteria bacterium]MDH5352012.1 class I SAM-dependent methyltransferase [Betaproteobacteria bacterium]